MTKPYRHIKTSFSAKDAALGRLSLCARPARAAHELAHGIGSLRHPFDDGVAVKGKTDNLMEICQSGSDHFQWDMMQNPPKRIFK